MKRLLAPVLAFAMIAGSAFTVAVVLPAPVMAQGNDNDYTPLGSRIRRNRQFPDQMFNPYTAEVGSATYERSRDMMGQFNRCIYDRSNQRSLELLSNTDYGFNNFAQIDLENERAARIYGFNDCLNRVARAFNSGVRLSWTAFGLRRSLIEQAYLNTYDDGPAWLQASYVIDPRDYPLSGGNAEVARAMDLADCIVAADPFTADYFFRTTPDSERELDAIDKLVPQIQPCLPRGQRIEINPYTLRTWIGEGLWHASQHSAPPVEGAE